MNNDLQAVHLAGTEHEPAGFDQATATEKIQEAGTEDEHSLLCLLIQPPSRRFSSLEDELVSLRTLYALFANLGEFTRGEPKYLQIDPEAGCNESHYLRELLGVGRWIASACIEDAIWNVRETFMSQLRWLQEHSECKACERHDEELCATSN
jgi:hypothetical protein